MLFILLHCTITELLDIRAMLMPWLLAITRHLRLSAFPVRIFWSLLHLMRPISRNLKSIRHPYIYKIIINITVIQILWVWDLGLVQHMWLPPGLYRHKVLVPRKHLFLHFSPNMDAPVFRTRNLRIFEISHILHIINLHSEIVHFGLILPHWEQVQLRVLNANLKERHALIYLAKFLSYSCPEIAWIA